MKKKKGKKKKKRKKEIEINPVRVKKFRRIAELRRDTIN